MINQQLIDYIKQQLGINISRQEIIDVLKRTGWQQTDIDEAFRVVDGIPSSVKTIPKQDNSLKANNFTGSTEIMGIGELLAKAWQIFKERFWNLLGIMILPALAGVVIILILLIAGAGGAFFGGLLNGLSGKSGTFNPTALLGSLGVGMLISFLVGALIVMFISYWSQLALIAEAVSEQKIGVFEAYRQTKGKILRAWALAFLSGLILFGASLLFIIPGIILSLYFSFSLYILIAEDIGGISALHKSKQYIKGHWWAVAGRIGFLFILYLGLLIIYGILMGIFSGFTKAANGVNGTNLPGSIIGFILQTITNFIVPLFSVVYSSLIYKNFKDVKGNFEFNPTGKSKTGYILLAIFGILGPILVAVGIISLTGKIASSFPKGTGSVLNPSVQVDKARDAVLVSDGNSIRNMILIYYTANMKYPQKLEDLFNMENPVGLQTQQRYLKEFTYETVGDTNFKLCTNLKTKGLTCIDNEKSFSLLDNIPGDFVPFSSSSGETSDMVPNGI